MSTTPGESTWADAGLVPPENEPIEIGEAAEVEHHPAAPRPDLRGEAAEPDVVDQALDAPVIEEDDDVEQA